MGFYTRATHGNQKKTGKLGNSETYVLFPGNLSKRQAMETSETSETYGNWLTTAKLVISSLRIYFFAVVQV